MPRKPRLVWLLCLPLLAASHSIPSETFEEELHVRALPDGKVASRFSFSVLLEGTSPRNPQNLSAEDESQHYTLFPLTLGQILREYAVTELHLTLNAGNWNYGRWGYPDEVDVGSGAELWAWMGEGGTATVDERWRGLRNALAGLFCASLGSLDELRTTSPALFAPSGGLPDWGMHNPHEIRHASLPSEHVCTENLTPFLKLLPCKSLSGIATLLNPHRLFDADWHGMGLHVSWLPEAGVQARLTFQSVTDPLRSSDKRDWSFASIFDRKIERRCPSATASHVVVSLPDNGAYSIQPPPPSIDRASNAAVFDLKKEPVEFDAPLDISMQWPNDEGFEYNLVPQTPLSVRRLLHGSSQDRGSLAVSISNSGNESVSVAYLETLPWIVQVYLHSMTFSINGVPRDDILRNFTYVPPIPHARAMELTLNLEIPARSTVLLKMDVTKAFLRYTEHPPDAQRGWDLPPAVLVPHGGKRMYTPTLLLDLATPDFSMPYNVIIFSCSLVAFIFGSVFNLLTRKFVVVKVESK
ncbi:Gpi16 subunit GPI transamidase component [Roridomyces roridus]|uniref:Gpi16 subunit GPI transamidase component n=1 Tax=Roridomyces roridus TaxID=1738132 RepID=A0AAD7BFN3_9AGAR|nr:Gpi16 subunit GPI transamidase component [Roridomyces roridus]